MTQTKKSNVSYLFLLVALVTGSIIFIVKMKPWESKKENDFDFSNEVDDFDLGQKFTTKKTTLRVCNFLHKTNDGKCHDEANTAICLFDAGDCCLQKIDDSECETCFCHTHQRRNPSALEVHGMSLTGCKVLLTINLPYR